MTYPYHHLDRPSPLRIYSRGKFCCPVGLAAKLAVLAYDGQPSPSPQACMSITRTTSCIILPLFNLPKQVVNLALASPMFPGSLWMQCQYLPGTPPSLVLIDLRGRQTSPIIRTRRHRQWGCLRPIPLHFILKLPQQTCCFLLTCFYSSKSFLLYQVLNLLVLFTLPKTSMIQNLLDFLLKFSLVVGGARLAWESPGACKSS